jgi:hypothetical protein
MTGCPACLPPGDPAFRPLHEGVPALTQYQSADLIEAIAYRGHDPGDDPRWPASGAKDQAQYARWCGQACGMTCLQMILAHRDGHAPPLVPLTLECAARGGYVEQADGHIRGLVYAPFTAYARDAHGLDAEVRAELGVDGVRGELDAGRMFIASVHKEIRRPERPAPGRGGHLVLVIGHAGGEVHFRNPSGDTAATRSARLPWEVFERFYAGRGVAVEVRRRVGLPV